MGSLIQSVKSFFSYLSPSNLMISDVVEIILIAFLFYYLINWIRDTKAWSLVKGLFILLIVWIIAAIFEFNAILWIFVNAVNVGIIALFIIFQPELRRALEQIGRQNISIFSLGFHSENRRFSDTTLQEIVTATYEMAKHKTGALIVIEGDTSLGEYSRTGISLDANVSAGLLINIFEHNTPLHDGAVIIRNDKILSATCILPVSDNMMLSRELGTRHRAGVGLSEVADGLIIIVSEETGKVSIARNGQLVRGVDEMYLKGKLTEMQMMSSTAKKAINSASKKVVKGSEKKKKTREQKKVYVDEREN